MSSTEAGPSTVVASRSSAKPDGWSPEDRSAAAAEERNIYERYTSNEYSQAVDAIHSFESACKARKVDYADAFLSGDMTADEYKKVDNARKHLMRFWKDVRILYKDCKLTTDGGDFFSPHKRWFRSGNAYRVLVEPLDIANWYKAGNHEKGSGDYFDHVNESEEKTKRPSQYAFLDRLMRDAGGDYKYSLHKAEEYARKRASGNLQIHKLEDARADPPRGFKRIGPLQIPTPTEEETGKAHIVGDPSKADATGRRSPASILDQKDPTPPPTPLPDIGNLSINSKVDEGLFKSTPPGWKEGVPCTSKSGRFKAPHRKLPEPTYGPDNKKMLPAGAGWSEDSQTAEIQVDYDAIVYKAKETKYLVVRATISTNVRLIHDDNRCCGYFQESLTFSMKTPGDVERRSGTFPLPPHNVEVLDIKVTEKEGKATNWGANASASVNLKGPSAGVGANVGQTRTRENAEERAYKDERVRMAFHTENGKLDWTWTVKRMEDGSLYADRAKRVSKDKPLGLLPTFARTSSVLEVQGTWSFPEDKKEAKDEEEAVTLELYVGQTLSYDAALPPKVWGGTPRVKTCVNRPDGSGVETVKIPLKLPGYFRHEIA